MHWFDSSIIALLAAAAVLGAYSGLLMQMFRLAGFAAAIYGAHCAQGAVAKWLQETLLREAEPRTCGLLAYGILFLGIYIATFFATLLLERGARAAQLQYMNRSLGALLAVAKMSLLIGAVCYGLQQFQHPATNQVIGDSAVAPLLVRGVEHAMAAVPEEYRNEWTNGWNQLREAMPQRHGKLKIDVAPPLGAKTGG